MYFKSRGGYQAEVLTGHAAEDEKFTGGTAGAGRRLTAPGGTFRGRQRQLADLHGVVDAADYTVWRDHLGQTYQLPNEGAGQSEGQVTVDDYNFWKSQFSGGSGAGAVSAGVPEPSSVALLIFAAIFCGSLRRWN